MPPEHLCIETGTFHRWVPAGTVRYLPADFLEAIEREAALPEPSLDVDRATVAKVLHGLSVGRGNLAACYHDTDGSECSYHAALFMAEYARLRGTGGAPE